MITPGALRHSGEQNPAYVLLSPFFRPREQPAVLSSLLHPSRRPFVILAVLYSSVLFTSTEVAGALG